MQADVFLRSMIHHHLLFYLPVCSRCWLLLLFALARPTLSTFVSSAMKDLAWPSACVSPVSAKCASPVSAKVLCLANYSNDVFNVPNVRL
jgi:hypothetical protein